MGFVAHARLRLFVPGARPTRAPCRLAIASAKFACPGGQRHALGVAQLDSTGTVPCCIRWAMLLTSEQPAKMPRRINIMSNFLHLNDLSHAEIVSVLDRADVLEQRWRDNQMPQSLTRKKVGLWFWGQGFRNRVAFEIGARAMGADVSYIPGELAVHEPIVDVSHYLDNWFSMLVIRCRSYEDLRRVATDSRVPVVNAKTNLNHPCEILGDLQYIRKKRRSLDDLRVVFVGEMTNLCMSWIEAAKALPIEVIQVGPRQSLMDEETLKAINAAAAGRVNISESLEGSISSKTDVVYTDCWPVNGNADAVREQFLPFQVTDDVLNRMSQDGFFLPCPPIVRGQEVSAEAVSHPRFCSYEAKDYLLHAQNALMEYCFSSDQEK